MALTVAGVCNLALARVGQREFIDSLEEATTQAQVCAAIWEATRDSCLAAAPWRFARRRAALALTTYERSGWAYVYALPSDCITPVEIYPGVRPTLPGGQVPFVLELDDSANALVLCTDAVEPELSYVRRLENPALWPMKFVQYVASALAIELALSLPVKPELARGLMPSMTAALLSAETHDNRSQVDDNPPEGESVRARR